MVTQDKRKSSFDASQFTGKFICVPSSIYMKQLMKYGISDAYELYLYILGIKTYQDYTTRDGIDLIQGEFILSPVELRKMFNLSKTSLHRYMQTLIENGVCSFVRNEKRKNIYQINIYPEVKFSKPRKKRATSETKAEKSLRDELFDLYTEDRCKVFYKDYHESLEIPEEGYSLVYKEWQKMTPEEREQAIHYISHYARANRKRDIKTKAVNYLKRGFALEYQLAKDEVPENIFKLWMEIYTERQMERKEQKDSPDRQYAIEYLERYASTVEELTK